MRLLFVLLLLVSSGCFAQQLVLTIDAITANDDKVEERLFKIKYHLQNTTKDTLRFFLEPKNVSPSTGGSLTKEIYYKLYENEKFIEVGQAFRQVDANEEDFAFPANATQEEKERLLIEMLAKKLNFDFSKLMAIYKEKGSIGLLDGSNEYMQRYYKKVSNYYHTLAPQQIEHFEVTFRWNKDRYYYFEPNEFYLDDTAKHYLELTFVALKEEYKERLDEELYAKIKDDPNFIKGVFVSNKVEINFKPN